MTTYRSTYSPDDNKLRLYATTRLDAQTFARIKTAGFVWAPKQELFVAPMWTPQREDLLLELCGEIDDEDTSLVDRAEERAERFTEYHDKRGQEAQRAQDAVSAITDHIPLGQPILVGHHSERHARKDAERIENGMRKAIKLWDTAKYWQERAHGAVTHAKYKERPDVRARRIKGLEADKRKHERTKSTAEKFIAEWTCTEKELTLERAKVIANYDTIHTCFPLAQYPRDHHTYEGATSLWSGLEDGIISAEQARDIAVPIHHRTIAWCNRWLAHIENRLLYEREMLEKSGGLTANRFDLQPGGRVLIGGEWRVILRVNKSKGVVTSVTTTPPAAVNWAKSWKAEVEEINDYRPPTAAVAEKVKQATKLPPLCNYPGEGFREMTQAEWDKRHRWSDFSYVATITATDTIGRHRRRQMPMAGGSWKTQPVFITDAKHVDPPTLSSALTSCVEEKLLMTEEVESRCVYQPREQSPEEKEIDRLRQALTHGVKTMNAPQLFPTPPALAARMVALAEIQPHHRVLEPCAGTGSLLHAIGPQPDKVAVEINSELVGHLLRAGHSGIRIHQGDFLSCNGDLGTFDRIVMNPPFTHGADIVHILHARKFLKPSGRLVALCAHGPRQIEQLRPFADMWEPLPERTFAEQDTGVRVVLLTMST